MDAYIQSAGGDYAAVRALFDDYTQTPGVIETCYKSYEQERDTLPGEFAEPHGRLYLALVDGEPAGCIAMRRFDDSRCEMKRLFVREDFRGRRIAHALVEQLLADARREGYRSMVLTIMDTMLAAQALYKGFGFVECAPGADERSNVIHFEKAL